MAFFMFPFTLERDKERVCGCVVVEALVVVLVVVVVVVVVRSRRADASAFVTVKPCSTLFIQVARLLLDHKADPDAANARNVAPLLVATLAGDANLVQGIIWHALCFNLLYFLSLCEIACFFGDLYIFLVRPSCLLLYHLSQVRLLLVSGANPDGPSNLQEEKEEFGGAHGESCLSNSSSDQSPLLVAVRWGRLSVVRLLLAHNANPNQCGASRRAPLHCCAAQANLSSRAAVATLLIEGGAHVNCRDASGATPLWLASAGSNCKS